MVYVVQVREDSSGYRRGGIGVLTHGILQGVVQFTPVLHPPCSLQGAVSITD